MIFLLFERKEGGDPTVIMGTRHKRAIPGIGVVQFLLERSNLRLERCDVCSASWDAVRGNIEDTVLTLYISFTTPG